MTRLYRWMVYEATTLEYIETLIAVGIAVGMGLYETLRVLAEWHVIDRW